MITIKDIYGISLEDEKSIVYDVAQLISFAYEAGKDKRELNVKSFADILAKNIIKNNVKAMEDHYKSIVECAKLYVSWTSTYEDDDFDIPEEKIDKDASDYVEDELGFSVKKIYEDDKAVGITFFH